jgi:hypothetical protein
MIKQLPGWLNYILLWLVYFAVGVGFDALCGFHTDKRFIGGLTAFFCGAYLAKWAYVEGEGWRFW